MTEILIRTRVIPNDNTIHHLALFNSTTATHVVFGDSHASLGFTGVPGFVNLAYPSESIPVIEGKVRRYLENHKPEQVIIQADPHLLSAYRESLDAGEINREYFKTPLFYFNSFRHKIYLVDYWKTYFSTRGFVNRFEFAPDGGQISHDALPKELTPKILRKMASRRDLQMPADNFEDLESARSYIRILNLLKASGAQICLVTFPVSPTYVEFTSTYPTFARAIDYYVQLAKRYGFHYENFWSAYSDNSYFGNQDHLNYTGARVFAHEAVSRCFGKP